MSWFEISVLILLGIVAVELFLLISAGAWFTNKAEEGYRIEIVTESEHDEADWWKDGDDV